MRRLEPHEAVWCLDELYPDLHGSLGSLVHRGCGPAASDHELRARLERMLSRGELLIFERRRGRELSVTRTIIPVSTVRDSIEPTKSWLEIALKDANGHPVSDVRFHVILANGDLRRGRLDRSGFARLDGIPEGECQIYFPDYDWSSWDQV